jgi:hypothetical protein
MGSEGGKYSRRKYLKVLERLALQHPDKFTIEDATKEFWKIKWKDGDPHRPFPIAANHGGISETIAKELGKLLEKHNICSKKYFLQMIS